MKFVIAFAAIIAVGAAQFPGFSTPRPFDYPKYYPSSSPSPVPRPVYQKSNEALARTLSYLNEIDPNGNYRYAYETENGIGAQAQGVLREYGGNPPASAVVSQGSFGWTSPEGVPVSISYIADENGYQPQGNAIPTPPAIPEAILRSLEYIARNPSKQ